VADKPTGGLDALDWVVIVCATIALILAIVTLIQQRDPGEAVKE
jgi:hypothetical protein